MQVTHKRINYRPNGGPFVSHSAYKFDSPPDDDDDHGSGLGTRRDETRRRQTLREALRIIKKILELIQYANRFFNISIIIIIGMMMAVPNQLLFPITIHPKNGSGIR